MAITNRGEVTPPDPEYEQSISSPDSYRAPTQEEAAERELLVPESDTSSNTTTVNQYPQAPEVAYPAAAEAPQKRSKLGLAIGGAILAAGIAAGAAFGLSSEKDKPKEVAAEDASRDDANTPTTTPEKNDGSQDAKQGEAADPGTVETEPAAPESAPQISATEKYPYLPESEAELLDALAKLNYPDAVIGEYDGLSDEDMLLAVANDFAGAMNSHDFDTFAQLHGYETYDEAFGEGARARKEGYQFFYAPDKNDVNIKECTTSGDIMDCQGYLYTHMFERNRDPNSPDTIEQFNDPDGIYPETRLGLYIELTFQYSRATGKFLSATQTIHEEEPMYPY